MLDLDGGFERMIGRHLTKKKKKKKQDRVKKQGIVSYSVGTIIKNKIYTSDLKFHRNGHDF